MLEGYTGSRPGRRSALLIATGLVLVGAVTAAWFQVYLARALGPAIAIPGTPLLVRLPANWKPDSHKPGAFILPTRGAPEQTITDFERRISFQYERSAGFRPPLELLTGRSNAEPARIGPFAALQVRQQERRRWGICEVILRVANLPNGDRVSVLYLPMSALTTADLELLDAICQAVRFNQPGFTVGWAEACRGAGIELPPESGWRAVQPIVAGVPGLFIGGEARSMPAWSVGVFRTWLAAGRSPADLLSDFAADQWMLDQVKITYPDWKRADGARIAVVRHPDVTRSRSPIVTAALIVQSPEEALLLFVYTDEHFVAAADAATESIARAVQLAPLEGIPEIASAEKAGREFAAKLVVAGAVPWWGQLPVDLKYAGSTVYGAESVSMQRKALGRNPVRGYHGELHVTIGPYEQGTSWEAASSGRYEFHSQHYVSGRQTIDIHETRAAPDQAVQRRRTLNDVEGPPHSFPPGPGFISPPLEALTESWVARESHTALINEYSTLLGSGTHTRLLRPLPPENGCARVLVQKDFWPLGEIVGFDDSGETVFRRSATGEYLRTTNKRL